MTVAEQFQHLTIDEAVEAVWEMVFSGDAEDPPAAARALWHRLALTDDDRAFFGILGLGEYAALRQRQARHLGRPAIAVGTPHGREWDDYLVSLTTVYDDAAGHPQPLIDFTLTDWAALAVRMDAQSKTYARRAELARKAEALLVEHGKTRARDLPKLVLRAFAAEAGDVLGRQDK